MHPFRFGVINEAMLPADQWFARVRQVEALGYAVLLLRDHLVSDFFGEQYAPIAALATAAAITTRLHVGTMVICNDFRHPAMLAKEAATLHILSGGRFELGIGAGWLKAEYEQANLPLDSAGTRIERLAESVTIMRGLWSAGPYSFKGRHYQINQLESQPKPVQPLPILIGGGQRRMLTIAGQLADSVGVLTTSVASGSVDDHPRERMATAVLQKLDWIREGAGARFEQIELSLIPTVVLTNDRLTATTDLIAKRGWQVTPAEVWEMPSVLIGSVAEIAATLIERRAQYGFSYYILSDSQFEAFAPVVAKLQNNETTKPQNHETTHPRTQPT